MACAGTTTSNLAGADEVTEGVRVTGGQEGPQGLLVFIEATTQLGVRTTKGWAGEMVRSVS